MQHLGVEVRTGLHVAAEQVVQVELAVHFRALPQLDELAVDFLLDALGPWRNGVPSKHEVLLLHVVVRGLRFELHQGRRHAENAANFLRLELAGLDELRLVRADANARVFEAEWQQLGASGGVGLVPGVLDDVHLLLFERLITAQNAGHLATRPEVFAAKLLRRFGQPKVFPVDSDGRFAAKVGYFKHVFRHHHAVVTHRKDALAIHALHVYVVMAYDVHCRCVAAVVALYDCVTDAVEHCVTDDGLPKLVCGLVVVRRVLHQLVCRVRIGCHHVAPVAHMHLQAKRGHCACDFVGASVDGANGHSRRLVDIGTADRVAVNAHFARQCVGVVLAHAETEQAVQSVA